MSLSHVLETARLSQRVPTAAKRRRLDELQVADASTAATVEELAEIARIRCGARSAGVSMFQRADPVQSRWIVVAGQLREFAGSRFPLRHSLCGVAAEYGATQLFKTPQRYFKWIGHAGLYISEALVTPMCNDEGKCFGTVWVMSHRGDRPRYDGVDARALESIAAIVAGRLQSRAATAALL
jgi:hypothetical protein